MPRHVAHVESKGLPTPGRVRRQRQILVSLSRRYPPETWGGRGRARPRASYAFSKRTSPEQAVSKLAALLDDVDPEWSSFVKVWDAFHDGNAPAIWP